MTPTPAAGAGAGQPASAAATAASYRGALRALRSASGHRRRCASSLSRTRKHGLSATRRAHVEERGQAHLQDPLEQARPGADARGAQVGPVRTQPLSQCPHARQNPQHEGRNKHRAGSIHCITLQLVCVCALVQHSFKPSQNQSD